MPPLVESMLNSAPHPETPLVEVDDLHVRFADRDETVWAVNGVSFTLMPGEVLCIIGESGSGKSVTMRALMRLLPGKRAVINGRVRIGPYDIMALGERELANVRGSTVAMIFQEPMTALDPVYTIGRQIAETVMRHEGCSRKAARDRALDILQLVKVPLPERRLNSYPHELSGGLRQRALIGMALSCRPRLVLADEPTTALDASVQIQILLLLRRLQQDLGMGLIFVTHDLGVAAQIADKVAVMYAGRIVEFGSATDVLLKPRTPTRWVSWPRSCATRCVRETSRRSPEARLTFAWCPRAAALRPAANSRSRPAVRAFPRRTRSGRIIRPAVRWSNTCRRGAAHRPRSRRIPRHRRQKAHVAKGESP
jgi:peptide/nickel transport system ATP-binding protein